MEELPYKDQDSSVWTRDNEREMWLSATKSGEVWRWWVVFHSPSKRRGVSHHAKLEVGRFQIKGKGSNYSSNVTLNCCKKSLGRGWSWYWVTVHVFKNRPNIWYPSRYPSSIHQGLSHIKPVTSTSGLQIAEGWERILGTYHNMSALPLSFLDTSC